MSIGRNRTTSKLCGRLLRSPDQDSSPFWPTHGTMQTAVLCEHIVHDLHGPVVGKVATILLERGQLTYVQLARLLRVPSPSFSHAQLRAALLVLIQHNMLFHSLGTQQDLFQISTVEIIARAWFGDFVGLAEEVAGPAGRIVTHCALLEGKVKVAELVQMAQTQAAEEDASVSERVYPTLVWLIQQRYLEPLTAKHYLTLENRYGALQKEALASHQAPSAKQKREAERGALVEFWDAVEEERDNAYARLTAGLQEALEEMGDGYGGGRPGKRRKYEDADDGLDSRGPGRTNVQKGLADGSYLRVNYDRFLFRMRNKVIKLIEGAARSQFGRAGAHVMRAILSLIEDRIEHQPKTMRLTSDISDSMSTSQIIDRMSALDPNGPTGVQSVIRGAFVQSCAVPMGVEASGTWSSTSQNTPYLVSELCERMAYTDDQSHLTSLRKEDDAAFDKKKKFAWISKVDTNSSYSAKGNEAWQVDFFACHLALKQAMAYAIVGHKLGKETVRVMRILDTHGRLEEKHIQKIALTSAKESRRHVDVLLQAGLVESQEVPKTADRLPSRSFYLWYVDWKKVAQALQGSVLQQLANIRERRRAETVRFQRLIEKAQRKDVQNDASLMKQDEWDEIHALDQRVEYLGVAEQRTMSDYLVLQLPTAIVNAKAIVPERAD